MPTAYDLVQYRGVWCLYWRDEDGQPRRRSLGTPDRGEAAALKAAIEEVELKSTAQRFTIAELWAAYEKSLQGRPTARRMPSEWHALDSTFGKLLPCEITEDLCKRYIAEKRAAGRADGTILGDMVRLSSALHFAERRGWLAKMPVLAFPRRPDPKSRHLTRDQVRTLIAACKYPHIRTFITLAITTGARKAALLDLTWDRVDFERRILDLRARSDPGSIDRRMKGRAVVPVNDTALGALLAAREKARTPYVIEWGGQRVLDVKKALVGVARAAGVPCGGAHIFRHSAAVWMAEDGRPMTEIAQYLGHDGTKTTERVYARYSPSYLRTAASSLEL